MAGAAGGTHRASFPIAESFSYKTFFMPY